MRLPAVCLTAAFAAGAGFALRWPEPMARLSLAAVALFALAGALLAVRRNALAWLAVLVAWSALGGLATGVERITVPANHVTRLIASETIDLTTPLRWRGHLRETPMLLPWGRRIDIDLESVEVQDVVYPISGGLRANLYLSNGRTEDIADDWLAGDHVQMLVKAREPRNFMDPGAYDERAHMAREHVDLIGAMRSGELLQFLGDEPHTPLRYRLAQIRGNLLARIDALFPDNPERAAVLRAMLLGDRSFVDNDVVQAFQKTSAYHVLVIAGLHVGAIIVFLLWATGKLKLGRLGAAITTLVGLAAYVGVVEDRTPILRAAMIAAFYLLARPLFRRIDLLNTVALAALVFLIWRPSSLTDSSFQLSFLAASVIAGLAIPWMDRTSAPYFAGLKHIGDVTRDASHPPRVAQFRIEMREFTAWCAARVPKWFGARMAWFLQWPVRGVLGLWDVVLLSVVIQLGMLPLMASGFHRISVSGPLSNVPAVLLTAIIVPLGFLALIATYVWGQLAHVLAAALSLCVGALLNTVQWFAKFPRMAFRTPDPPAWLVMAFFAAIVALAWCAREVVRRRRAAQARRAPSAPIRVAEWLAFTAVAVFAVLIATHPFKPDLAYGKFQITVLDVGQGDSLFLSFPNGHTMLMDGGGLTGSETIRGSRSGFDVGENVVSPFLWWHGLKHVDVLALTHAHHDHLDGLRAVLENFSVGELWVGRDEETTAFTALLDEARAHGVKVVTETQGSTFNFDGVEGQVLWPVDVSRVERAANDNSMVVRVQDGAERFLLPGDAEKRTENAMVDEGEPLSADFLKVPHHGSRTSSTEEFLAAVQPKVAVVSVGEDNPFGHPVPAVVQRYQAAGVRFLRTDKDGAVTATTDGKTLTVMTYAEQHPQQP
jgi:competence protein ComEC